jgi:hypothetical protein
VLRLLKTCRRRRDRRHRVERSSGDDSANEAGVGRRRETGVPDLSVAVADQPASMSGTHWANRDNDTLYRRPGQSTPFRRPPAENSFPGEAPESPGPADMAEPGFPAPSRTANADLFGPDPDRFGPNGDDDEESTATRKARHWTTIGTRTRRPRTSDRGEASAPLGAGPQLVSTGKNGKKGRGRASAAVPVPVRASHGRAGRAAAEAERDDTIGVLGQGHEIRPHRAGRGEPGPQGATLGNNDNTGRGTPNKNAPTAAPRRPRGVMWATVAMVFVVLVGGAGAVLIVSGKGDALTSVLRSGAGSSVGRTATAPLDGRTEASFELVTGTTKVTLRSEDLGSDLYRITTAADSGTVPRPVVDANRVQLHLAPDGDGASGNVEVVLAAKVTWSLRFTGGADEQRIDLGGGKVSGIDVIGGARRVELTLPTPAGTVPVRVTGAVDEFVVRAPANSPVRVHLDSGAKTVAAGEKTQRDVPPGSTFTPRNWQVDNRYDVDAASRVTLFSVTATG